MNEQIVLLLLLILVAVATMGLYVWRAKKQIEYRNDERWKFVLLKAQNIADISNWILILILAILVSIPAIQDIAFPLKRIIFVGLLYFGFHNCLELFGIIYYNHKL